MIERAAFYLEENDEEPNIALAIQLCKTKDSEGIKEIIDGLKNKNQQVANDCIKVLYGIGVKFQRIYDCASAKKREFNRRAKKESGQINS
jgi:hypothetical protein